MTDSELEGFEKFCGSTFWDLNVTWNTHSFPRPFTPCFERTVLVWLPCGFLWLFAIFDLNRSIKSKSKGIPWTIFNVTKIAIVLALAILEILNFAYSFKKTGDETFEIYSAHKYSYLIKACTFILAFVLLLLNKNKGIHSSGIQFMFWFLSTICSVFAYQSSLRNLSYNNYNDHEKFWFIILQISYPLIVFEFIFSFFTDGVSSQKGTSPSVTDEKEETEKTTPFANKSPKISPEVVASFPSRLTFQWFWALAYLGYKKPLVFDDLWDLNTQDKSSAVLKNFYQYWKPALAEAQKWNARHQQNSDKDKTKSLSKDESDKMEKKNKKNMASVLPAICKANWDIFLFGAGFKLLQDVLTFVSPQILDLLIDHVSGDKEFEWRGFFYAFLLAVTAFLQTIFLGQYFMRMFIVGMRIRSALIGAIFEKSLIISNAARKESTLGEIVNLMSVDSQRFMDLTTYVNMLWSAPLQIGLSLYFLYNTLGASVFAGVGIMLLMIPVNAFMANKVKTLQIQQMKNKDQRVKLMNEILSGMKVLKLMAWEPSFEKQVNEIRNRELRVLRTLAYLNSTTILLWTIAPFLVSLVTFATYVLIDEDNVLDSRKAFVSLSLFNIMRMPMSILPNILVFIVEAGVSLKRVNKFMNADEIDPDAVKHDVTPGSVITVDKGNFSWDDQLTLKNINMNIKKGSLVAVVGSVGSGKSSLLSAILGEMQKKSGDVNTKGSIAYVAQQAWIQNATLRDNILFGNKFDPATYKRVIDVCALKPDLAILSAGDKTEIGEKGINLSGGQKQRISLARSVYSDSDIYLLDDPLSAVDSHVGKHLFDKMIGPKGILNQKTRVIVTHGVTYLPHVDYIIVMNNGVISETGTFNQLLEKKGAFADFLIQHAGADDLEQADSETAQKLEQIIGSRTEVLARQSSRISESEGDVHRRMSAWSLASKKSRQSLTEEEALKNKKANVAMTTAEKLIEVEKAETGSVKRDVYAHYLTSLGWNLAIISMIFYIVCNGLALYSNIWLSQWSTDPSTDTKKRDTYLSVYGALGMGQAVSIFLGNLILSIGCLKAARYLQAQMLSHTLRCPMSWYDSTPIGRIVNRFSKDVDVADSTFPANLRSWLSCLFNVIGTLVAISYSSPWFLVVVVPIGIIYYVVQRFYVKTSRQLKRLESISRSPIYSHFGETLTGAMTIRAFQRQQQFIHESERTVDHNQIAYYPSIVANRWLAIRLESVGNMIILFSALFAILGDSDAGSVGLSVSYALSITQTLNWLVRMTSDVETNVVAVERIKEYGETAQEAAWEIEGRKPPKAWPENGVVQFDNYQTRYREGLDLVLKNVTCKIDAREKVGIVGRTGAGKSSLTLALFRIVEAAGGSITIDGQNISKLGLHDVRERLTIIPQDPVLFSGDLRMNLDPFNKYSDNEIWHALEFAHLKDFVNTLQAGLHHDISEGGENLSVGQRQLICLARALLRKTKILVLDEATAAVDLETDDLIQATIRSEFKECTVLTIAHRLNTIMDYDRVMVLNQGEVVEFEPPQSLLKKDSSIFYSMAKDAGLV